MQQLKDTSQTPEKKEHFLWLGITLIVLSTLLYVCLFALPFLLLDGQVKVGIGVGLVVSAEITLWVGGTLVGTSIIARYRRFLDPRRWLHGRAKK